MQVWASYMVSVSLELYRITSYWTETLQLKQDLLERLYFTISWEYLGIPQEEVNSVTGGVLEVWTKIQKSVVIRTREKKHCWPCQ